MEPTLAVKASTTFTVFIPVWRRTSSTTAGLPLKYAKLRRSAENAMKYFVDVQQWARGEGVRLFYFSSFDEPWKLAQEGVVGTQWGLWDKGERLKHEARQPG